MKVTMSSEMGIHSVWYLALHGEKGLVQAPEIAECLKVSPSYVVKILKKLAREGILASKRGKNGGFRLGRAPQDINLADVIVAVEGDAIIYECLHDDRSCAKDQIECPVHTAMRRADEAALDVLRATTVEHLVEMSLRSALALSSVEIGPTP